MHRTAQLAALTMAIAGWQLAGMYWLDAYLYSTPAAVWQRLVEWFTVGTPIGSVWKQILTSFLESAVGFAVGAIVGVSCGVLVGASRLLSDFFGPLIRAANVVPSIVLVTLLFIWFELGTSSKVATVIAMVFFATFFATYSGIRDVDARMLQEADLFGVGAVARITTVIVPLVAPRIVAGLRSAAELAWIGAIMAEFIGGRQGLGLLVRYGEATFDATGILAGMIVITVIAVAGKVLLTSIERWLHRAH
ncbi:ABC transporter permease [Dactylosporangium sp. NPDC049742]|uniref:ABC transporter permease n=1 Tax=Dactylosporangium sp. NPDC049742 TaxID=3154737 RepID=UPI003433DC13